MSSPRLKMFGFVRSCTFVSLADRRCSSQVSSFSPLVLRSRVTAPPARASFSLLLHLPGLNRPKNAQRVDGGNGLVQFQGPNAVERVDGVGQDNVAVELPQRDEGHVLLDELLVNEPRDVADTFEVAVLQGVPAQLLEVRAPRVATEVRA